MNKPTLLLISIFALALSACGGGSSSSSTTNETTSNTTTTDSCAFKTKTLTLFGIKYNTADYDKDGDGCLSTKEFNALNEKAKADAAKLQADIEARTVKAESTDIKNTSTEFPQIQLFSIVGSDKAITESGAKYAVLDANKNGGKFLVIFKFNRNLNLDKSANKQETLRIGISPDASADMSAKTKPIPDHLNLTSVVKERSGEELRLACTYSGSAKKYTCLNTDTDLAASITIPGDANLFLLMCQGPDASITCTNHANIKLKLK